MAKNEQNFWKTGINVVRAASATIAAIHLVLVGVIALGQIIAPSFPILELARSVTNYLSNWVGFAGNVELIVDVFVIQWAKSGKNRP